MFKTISLCLLSQLASAKQLVTTVSATEISLNVTVNLTALAEDLYVLNPCGATFGLELRPKPVASLLTTEFVASIPSQIVTIDIPTATEITTTTIVAKNYYNAMTRTSYLKPSNYDYDNTSSEEEDEKMIGSRALKKYIERLIAYKIESKFKNRYDY